MYDYFLVKDRKKIKRPRRIKYATKLAVYDVWGFLHIDGLYEPIRFSGYLPEISQGKLLDLCESTFIRYMTSHNLDYTKFDSYINIELLACDYKGYFEVLPYYLKYKDIFIGEEPELVRRDGKPMNAPPPKQALTYRSRTYLGPAITQQLTAGEGATQKE